MVRCNHCQGRKGKRSCPALGSVCTLCCGQHREGEIACPPDCGYLLPAYRLEAEEVDALVSRLAAFLQEPALARLHERALLALFDLPCERPAGWELPSWVGYEMLGCEDEGGLRAVDLFAHAESDRLGERERRAIGCLREAWAALFEVERTREGHGLWLRDLVTGRALFVHSPGAAKACGAGDHVLSWVVPVGKHFLLRKEGFEVPGPLLTAVQRALEAELGRLRGLDPGAPQAVLQRRAVPAGHRALREATASGQVDLDREGAACQAVYEIEDGGEVATALVESGRARAVPETSRFALLDGKQEIGEVELRTVRLVLRASRLERLERAKRIVARLLGRKARHRFDTCDRQRVILGEERPRLTPPRPGVWSPPEVTIREFHKMLEPHLHERGGPGGGAVAGRAPMAHVAMWREVHGSQELVSGLVEEVRRGAWWSHLEVVSREELSRLTRFQGFLESYARHLHDQRGASGTAAIADAELLANHLEYLVNFELHRRKTLWVDESLAFMLAQTRIDISGACLRLPFPCCAFVFTDANTLDLCASMLADEECGRLRGRPLDLLTVYALGYETGDPDTQGMRLFFLVDAGTDGWPFIVCRDLCFRPEDNLEAILDSHHPDTAPEGLDPLFLAPELKRLEHLVINAILYTTSAHLAPLSLGQSLARSPDRSALGLARGIRERTGAASDEDVFYLPGRIPISRIRQLGDLQRRRGGATLMKRFMVRGHWRRAPERWHDQRLRWIEPYWKGPELAPLLEREYILKA